MAKACQICSEVQSKYKCPSCLVPYCSLVCFKKHKENSCAKPVSTEEKSNLSTADRQFPVERTLNVNEPGEVVPKMELESIAAASDIRYSLQDESLQKIIRSINCSSDPETDLDKAMEVESFRILADKILSVIRS